MGYFKNMTETLSQSVRAQVQKAVDVLARRQKISAVYIFGSQVNGTANKWSDIDVAVFMDGIEKLDIRDRARLTASAQKEAGDELEVHFFRRESLEHPIPASFAQFVLTTGVRLDQQ